MILSRESRNSNFFCFSDILGFAKKSKKKIHTVWQKCRFFDILGFAKKTQKNTNRVTKPANVTKFKSVTLWHLEMSQNVTKCHTFSNLWYKATFLVFMFGSGSERLWEPSEEGRDVEFSRKRAILADCTPIIVTGGGSRKHVVECERESKGTVS